MSPLPMTGLPVNPRFLVETIHLSFTFSRLIILAMTLGEDFPQLADLGYWDNRYTESLKDGQPHEWYRSFDDLEEFFKRFLFHTYSAESDPRILHLGSGESTVPQDLARQHGYRNQLCVDFSTVVITMMTYRHADIHGIRWQQMDVRQMDRIPSHSIDVAFDKGTLDSMIHGSPWTPPPDVVDSTGRYMRELTRVLKPTGTFICVTFRQPHFVRPLLNCEGTNWDINVETLGGLDSSFGYYGFKCTLVVTRNVDNDVNEC
ncbi:S-adenosyl-L-methionine-dependent methyltransferase [Xylaria curta]|nr:S-adenosyl-L-methionine-dependent methyltransferase [Xylaria curta]